MERQYQVITLFNIIGIVMSKKNIGRFVRIFKDTPEFNLGGVRVINDYNKDNNQYFVGVESRPLIHLHPDGTPVVGEEGMYIQIPENARYYTWVSLSNCELINFKSNSFWNRHRDALFFTGYVISDLAYHVYTYLR